MLVSILYPLKARSEFYNCYLFFSILQCFAILSVPRIKSDRRNFGVFIISEVEREHVIPQKWLLPRLTDKYFFRIKLLVKMVLID